jgi:hypothetical protein
LNNHFLNRGNSLLFIFLAEQKESLTHAPEASNIAKEYKQNLQLISCGL